MQVAAGMVPTFPVLKTHHLAFHKCYAAADAESMQQLEYTSTLRDAMVEALNRGDSAGAGIAIDAYVPRLMGVMDSVDKHNGAPRSTDLHFTWTSGADLTPGKKNYRMFTLSYELCMVMMARGYIECNKAGAALERPPEGVDDPSKYALACMKNAGSIFGHVSRTVLPLKESLPFERQPEVLPEFANALELLCRTSCQLLAINQALVRGLGNPLVGKLYSGGAQIALLTCNVLESMKKDIKDINAALRNFVGGSPAYLLGVAHRLIGKCEWDEGKYGEGLAHLRESKKYFDTAYTNGLLRYASASLNSRVEADRILTQKLLDEYEKDNGLIYFGRVPASCPTVEAKAVAAETADFMRPPPAFLAHFLCH